MSSFILGNKLCDLQFHHYKDIYKPLTPTMFLLHIIHRAIDQFGYQSMKPNLNLDFIPQYLCILA